jgi:serine/threonine protein kinase
VSSSLVGRTAGKYHVVAELGWGQHAVVYKAWQPSLERYVALKVLRHHDEAALKKFQAEAQLTARLIEDWVPNVRQVYEVGRTEDGHIFVALEYVEDSLRSIMQRAKERNRQIDPAAAARLLKPVAEALDALHRLDWVHLDIKPQNILIAKGGRAMLADFGIAQRRGTHTHACTPAYASPEQAAGDRPVGPWSDIYSLGVVLYEMVTGRPPVRGEHDLVLLNQHLDVTPPSPRKFHPRISAQDERAILRALAKSPEERYGTAGQLIQDILPAGDPVAGAKKQARATRSGGLRRIAIPLLAGSIVVLLLVTFFLVNRALEGQWPFSAPGATDAPPLIRVVTSTPMVPALPPSATMPTATATRRPTAVRSPTSTKAPTATLAPTFTRTARPTATRTREPAPEPPGGITVVPGA